MDFIVFEAYIALAGVVLGVAFAVYRRRNK
jgi:hypothetical protein